MRATRYPIAAIALAASPLLSAESNVDGRVIVAQAAQASPTVDGEVKKIDKDAGKITLKHGAIANLGMPPMSMVFRAKDPARLDLVKPGEKVRFKADRVEGALTVTEIEPVH